ncbi:MAG: hypothetical protein IKC31_03955 [Clostridia bacterium]|nr:hypothetical protein [Clostridia bacterium]
MNQDRKGEARGEFRPTLQGCVSQDLRLARAMEDCYVESMQAFLTHEYRATVLERTVCEAKEQFEALASAERSHLRLIGELILELGGNPCVRASFRIVPIELNANGIPTERALCQTLCEAIAQERRKIDRYQMLMGHTQDRVVRSVLDFLASGSHRFLEKLISLECSMS